MLEASEDLKRILELPRRPIIDCERDRATRLYSPAAIALINVETAKYTRGPRLTCGCRTRRVLRHSGGDLTVFSEGRPGAPPPLPVFTTVDTFLADASFDAEVCEKVGGLRAGAEVTLQGIGRPCITSFNPVQAWLSRELSKAAGAFGFLPIGCGKTIGAFIASLAMPGVKCVLLLAKQDQRRHYVTHRLHMQEHFCVPSLVLDKSEERGSYIVEGAPVVHFLPYTTLQMESSATRLESIDPDMVVADEAHCLAAAPNSKKGGSTRAGRFLRYAAKRNDEGRPIIFCCWSGSLVNKSILDMTHLASFSLGMGSPYPIDPQEAERWALVVDPSRMADRTSSTATALRRAFGRRQEVKGFSVSAVMGDDAEDVRKGIKARAVETLGVISSKSSSVACSISIHERAVPPMPSSVKEKLRGVREESLRPDGDVIVEQVKQIAVARQVGCGFFSFWRFVGNKCTGDEKSETICLCLGCAKIDGWYAARKMFGRALRERLLHPETHMDSPALCANAARRAFQEPRYDGDLPVWSEETWPPWEKVKDTVPHYTDVEWIDDWFARDAAKWATEHRGIVWYESVALGERIAKLAGIECHGGGKGAGDRIIAGDGKKSICASISSHHEGRDGLQYLYEEQYVIEPPASGKAWDQLLGRLAREGQTAEEIKTWVAIHTTEAKDAMRKALEYADFDESMSPSESFLLAADIDFEL